MKSTLILSVFAGLLVSGAVHAAGKAKATAAAQTPAAPASYKPVGNPSAPQGGTFNVSISLEPESLNPITSTDGYSREVQSYILDTLLERNPDTYEWMPALAEKWEVSKDGKQFTFTLRKGATFHDGKPITVEDVKFSFDVIFDPTYNAIPLRSYFENIAEPEILGPDTIRFTAKSLYYDNFATVAELMRILPKHVYGNAAEGKKLNKTVSGSGPYKIEKYDKGQSIVLVKNKDWWGAKLDHMRGRWNFERIRFRFIKDSNIAIEALKKGDTDFHDLTTEEFAKKTSGPEWGKSVMKVQTQNIAPRNYGYIGWNLRKDLFKNRDVRLALYQLLNREEMNQKFRYGLSVPATGPICVQSDLADPSVKPVKYDPKSAIDLLKKAGWTDSDKDGNLHRVVAGKKENFSFTLYYANKDTEKYWVLYQADLKKVGIEMKLQLLEWNALLKDIDESNFDAIAMSWGNGSVDYDLKQIWHSDSANKGGSNFIGYKNPEVDKLIDQARAEMDRTKRIPIARAAYKKIAEDYPYAFLFNDKFVMYAHSAKVAMLKPTYKYGVGNDYWWATK